MKDAISGWLSPAGFMPHGHCYLWNPGLVWLQVLSNVAIALAYFSISLTLAYLVRRIKELPFQWVYLAFGAFIVACGITHVLDIIVIWRPVYWLDGGFRAVTAVASAGTAALLFPLAGKLAALVVQIRERERSAEELQQSEERLRSLIDGVQDYAIFMLDQAGLVATWNPGAARMKGYAESEVLGRHLSLFFPPEEIAADRPGEALRRAASEGRYEDEGWRVRKDGSRFWAQGIITALKDRQGGLRGFAKITKDVTDRKRAEGLAHERGVQIESLNYELAALLDTLFQTAPIGLGYLNRDLRFVRINDRLAEMHDLPVIDHLGRSATQLLYSSAEIGLMQEVLDTGEPVLNRELSGDTLVRPGHLRYWQTSYYPVLSQKQAIGVGCIVQEITERKQTELEHQRLLQQGQEVMRVKDEFISTVSHELRTPLTSIRGSLGLIAAGHMGTVPAEALQMLQIAVSNTDRLVRLINDILDIERIESGHVTMEKRECQAADLMTSAGEGLLALAGQAGVALEISPCAALLCADPDRVAQVLTNLLGNAIKFSPPGSTIRLTGERREDELVLVVADQGRGIPADKLESIFGRFQQVDSSDSRDKGGTGLGLAICRTIAKQHGGRLWVESEPGQGSTFFFALPVAPKEQGAPQAAPEIQPTVLVCDDDAATNALACKVLAKHGYGVIAVSSGKDALEQAMARRPDAILLDMMMPQMNGWETMAVLKEHPETRDIPIAVYSATKPPTDLEDQKQITAWVAKSGGIPRLLGGIKQALEQRRDACRVVLVEDDPDLARVLTMVFTQKGIATAHARSAQEAIALLDRALPNLMVLDVLVPGGGAFAVVERLRQRGGCQHLPLVVYTIKDLDLSERQQLDLGRTLFLTKGRVPPALLEEKVRAILDQDLLTTRRAPAPFAGRSLR